VSALLKLFLSGFVGADQGVCPLVENSLPVIIDLTGY